MIFLSWCVAEIEQDEVQLFLFFTVPSEFFFSRDEDENNGRCIRRVKALL